MDMKTKSICTLMLCFGVATLLSQCSTREPKNPQLEWPPALSAAVEKAPTVSLCELVSKPDTFDKHVVRTSALFAKNLENEFLHDSSCGDNYVWVEFDPAYQYSDDALKKKFEQIACLRKSRCDGKALVTVVGRFDGIKDGPYGHLDGYTLRFSIIRLEQVEKVESTPKDTSELRTSRPQ
jgi:hypothetical protein